MNPKHQVGPWDGIELSRQLREMIDRVGRPDEPVTPIQRSLADAREAILSTTLPVPATSDLLGERPNLSATAYHLDCLDHLDGQDPSSRAKFRFHLLLLAQLVDPLEPTFLPKVTVIIPAADDHATLAQTIASAARQTYRSLEIIVVDAGSTDGSATLVASLPTKLRLIHEVRCSREEALRRGVMEATGEFVHFLEPGDELDATAIEEKVSAWHSIPDARLCLSGWDGSPSGFELFDPPTWEDARSLLGDPYLSAASRSPLAWSSVLLPRWFAVSALPRVRVDSVSAHVFAWADAGLRVAAVPRPLSRRFAPRADREADLLARQIDADLALLENRIGDARHFRYLAPLATRITWMIDRAFDLGVRHDAIESWDQRAFAWEGRVGRGLAGEEGVSAILLDQILAMLRQKTQMTTDPTRPMLRLWAERQDRLVERLGEVKYVTGSDLRRWLPELPPRPFRSFSRPERVALQFGLEQLQISLVLGELPIRFRSLERVAADFPGHPYERYWASAFRLARLVGDDTARLVFRQKLVRRGWQWMGRARRAIATRELAAS